MDGERGPTATRRSRPAGILLAVVMVGATGGILGMVVRNSVLLGRMTEGLSLAQQRATNLHNLQVAMLHMQLELDGATDPADAEDLEIREGLVVRMTTVVITLFEGSPGPARVLIEVRDSLNRFPWSKVGTSSDPQMLLAARTLVSQVEDRVNAMYYEQEKLFYDATARSLETRRDSQIALIGLVSLVAVVSACWLVVLRRRTRSRIASAYAALVTEVSECRALQEQLSHQAFHDGLTGLPNRALFIERLEAEMAGTAPPSVALVDLDGFKHVNDTLGHQAGDELLQRMAERLRACVRAGDTVARLGGDEFAVVVRAGGDGAAEAISRRLIDALREPIRVAGQELGISASVGIAHLGDQAGADELLADADIAMYAAKSAGKARFEVFHGDMRDRAQRRARLEHQLTRAVDQGEIDVFYQPIVGMHSERVVAVEALARWRHPVDGLVSPAEFIPVAEETGLIREIGREVLGQACRTVQEWRGSVPGYADLTVAVNVSVRQLLSGVFTTHVLEALAVSGLPAEALTLEITESMALEDSEMVTAELDRIRGLGVRLAMDDFGAGYSSIASLLRLRVHVLKIDKTFLDLDNRNRGTLLRAVTEMGHTLGLTVVAEGVETAEHLAHLRAADCDMAQGYLLARPMPAADA
ncbi:EAL domain-containing protein, partial [Actinoplanes sp. NPDC051633]|uniref:putative bifunctional diguanylate cyclase/phosphodiesterase n=1 Tax=Actinoplanes sp. NPDC051633 TaxID=3155670 RepID=UPI00344AE29A